VYWSKTGGAAYTEVDAMMVTVSADTSTVSVASDVTCSLGGRSVPILVSADACPHTDVTVSMGL